jgi:hypothetical protein
MTTPTYTIKGSSSMNEGTAQIFTFQTTGLSEGSSINYTLSGLLPWRIQNNLSSGTLTIGSTGQASLYVWVNSNYYTDGPSNLIVSIPGKNTSFTVEIVDSSKTPTTLYTVQEAIDFYNTQLTKFNLTPQYTVGIRDSAANIASNTQLLSGVLNRVAASVIPIEPHLSSTSFYNLYSRKGTNNIVSESIKDSTTGIISSLDKISQYKDYLKDIEILNGGTFSINASQLNSYSSVLSKITNLDFIEVKDNLQNIGALNVSGLSNDLFHLNVTGLNFNASVVGGVVSQIDLRELGSTSFAIKSGGTPSSPSIQIDVSLNNSTSSITLSQELSKLSVINRQSFGNVAQYFVNKSQVSISKTNEVFNVTVNGHTDSVSNLQRFMFNDRGIAFDTGATTGNVVKYIGAIFGPSQVQNPTYVGIGLNYLDKKLGTDESLVNLALNTALGSGYTNEQEVQLLFKNLLGIPATKSDVTYWSSLIESGTYTKASLAIFAANSTFNTDNIQLVGISQTGVEYIPVT